MFTRQDITTTVHTLIILTRKSSPDLTLFIRQYEEQERELHDAFYLAPASKNVMNMARHFSHRRTNVIAVNTFIRVVNTNLGVPPHTNKPKKGNKDHIFLAFQTKILIKLLLVVYKFMFA